MQDYKNITYEDMCMKVKDGCSSFNPQPANSKFETIPMTIYQVETVATVLRYLTEKGEENINLAQDLIKDIFSGKRGKMFETLVYGWLIEHSIPFLPQPKVEMADCFKKEKDGYQADGQIGKVRQTIFDVKQFGIGSIHLETLRRRLQEKFPEHIICIEGDLDCSTEEIRTHLLENIRDISAAIKKQIRKRGYFYTPPGLENRIVIRFPPVKDGFGMTVSESDMRKWAMNNRFYFLKHGSQFCTNVPYIIFCPFDSALSTPFTMQDAQQIYWQLRFLCRRMFIELSHMNDRRIAEFDGKARSDITVACAARKLSAIIFLDVTDKWEYNNCRVWVYTNPNADHPIPKYQIGSWFRNYGAYIEDFEYDNY